MVDVAASARTRPVSTTGRGRPAEADSDGPALSSDLALAAGRAAAVALSEDLHSHDVTTLWTVPEELACTAVVVSKATGVIAGLPLLQHVLGQVDRSVAVELLCRDGDHVRPGQVVARLSGSARSIISAERTAVNFLQRMSGIATLAARFVDAVREFDVVIRDTRKTAPGLRMLDKYAVTCGGAVNHRRSLAAMVLIKENHIAAAGGVARAISAARAGMERSGEQLELEVEVTQHDEAMEAMSCSIDWLLLDNLTPTEVATVVRMRDSLLPPARRPRLEASGNVSLDTVVDTARTGVDAIAIGSLTHSAPALDLSLLLRTRRT
ncbi:carboxylating nicotinate-nucleotide diphosphorylase [Nocardioides sp. TF02-7]|uniref:carboxylating nicotinate-nucleotide diphosphorylase n=1 Tax=Nocardioides sp. TF02-7 TaxID=2917724 RepID=UPI001F05300D|nr:carboxylating nicotinate-nucleotide diphosphorylase [Nocardioides sp. TF02-7]UMG94123.1 carboxylating nicotinate-nucleotide diphosphorylase [Nocardioides sp. TF02-7]